MPEVRAMHDSMDGGVRTASGTAVEEQLPRRAGAAKHTTPWMEEVEPRREQRSRTCDSGHPWRLDVGRIRAPKAGVGVGQLVLDLAAQFRHQSVVLQIKNLPSVVFEHYSESIGCPISCPVLLVASVLN